MSGDIWVLSYVLLWLAVLVLGVAVVALLRQIGVLHARVAPMGVHPAGEGPELGADAPLVKNLPYSRAALTLLAFTSPTCEVCAVLRPSLQTLGRQYPDVRLELVDLDADTRPTFDAFNVRSTPYLVAVDAGGVVRGRGVANTLEQIEELVETARSPA